MLPSVNLPEPFEALAGVVGEGEAVHPLVAPLLDDVVPEFQHRNERPECFGEFDR